MSPGDSNAIKPATFEHVAGICIENGDFEMSESMTQLLARLEAFTERAESAESELLAVREDNHSMMLEIDGLRTERDRLAAELAKLRDREAKQKPVAMVDAGDDGYFAEILPDCSVGVGDMLYAFPPLNVDPVLWQQSFDQWWDAHGQYLRAGGGQYEKTFAYHAWEAAASFYAAPVAAPAVPAPSVPEEWKRAASDFLESHDAAWHELFKSLPADTRSVTVSNHQADAVRKANVLRALLQTAEVRHDNAAADRLLEGGK